MSSSEKKNKRKGIIGTILFHTLLLIAFLFMGLTYQIPPPPEEGISINFGYVDEGVTEAEPEDKSETPEPVQEEIVEGRRFQGNTFPYSLFQSSRSCKLASRKRK